ncbi:MAG: peptidyl-prolyl cis-trans isomerase [Solirubrobacterales bacterium]|jgi:peptidyl-prolyl cis-trans isomerase SurA
MLRRHVLLLSLLLLGVAPLRAEILERIIAKVNGEIITQTEFQSRQLAAAQAARVEPDKVAQFLRENNAKILQEAVDDILLVQRAEDAGLHLRPEYVNEMIEGIKKENKIESDAQFQEQLSKEGMTLDDLKRNIERSIVRRQILNRDIEAKIAVTESEARAEYDKRLADYTKPPTVSLLEILVKDEGGDSLARAQEILAQARQGEDFGALARATSASPTRATGGDLGKLVHGDLNPEIEKIAFALPVGSISDPIPTSGGYRLLKVTARTEGSVVPFDQAKDEIKQSVMNQRWAKEYDTYIQDLRKKAIVDLRVREVPLQLTGPVPSPVEGGSLLDKVPEAPAPGAPQAPAAVVGPAAPPVDPEAEIVTTGSAEPERVAPPPPVQGPEPEKKPPQH